MINVSICWNGIMKRMDCSRNENNKSDTEKKYSCFNKKRSKIGRKISDKKHKKEYSKKKLCKSHYLLSFIIYDASVFYK